MFENGSMGQSFIPFTRFVYITNARCLEEITSQKCLDKKLDITKRHVFQSRGTRSLAETTDVPTTSGLQSKGSLLRYASSTTDDDILKLSKTAGCSGLAVCGGMDPLANWKFELAC